nr:hypothetical protein [Tanacetum cinerariifolium]
MDTTIDQQVAMDEALVPHAQRLRIGRRNSRMLSDIKSMESTLQLVYDVLCLCPFFKAFLVTADVPQIYMQEFWATATVHHHAIRFKMDNKKHIVNLESSRDMLHICPRVEQKVSKKSNEIYYPWFTKVIIYHFMSKDPSIPRRNKVNWHYVRDDHMFSTIKLPKASVRKTRSSSDTTITPPTAVAGPRLTTSTKGKQAAKASKAKSLSSLSEVATTEVQQLKLVTKRSLQQTHISQASGSGADEGTGSIPGVPDVPTDESEEELSWNSTKDEGNNEGKDGDGDDGEEGDGDDDDKDNDGKEGDDDNDDQEVKRDDEKDDAEEGGNDKQEYDEEEYDEETRDEESFDLILKTPKNSDDEGNGEEDLGLNVGRKEGYDKEEEEDELYRDININQGRGIQATLEVEDSHMTLNLVNPDGQQQSSSVSSQFVTNMLNPTFDVGMESIFETTSQIDAHTPTSVALLPMTAPTMTPSTIATITTTSQAPTPPATALSSLIFWLAKIIKDQVKEQVKVQVSKILPRIEQTVNEQLEAEVLTQSSYLSKTSYVVAADLSEMELTKILIKKMEGNKSIQRSDEQRNLYKALVEAYESDKIILNTYGETVTLKSRRDDDADKDEEPSAGPDRGSKRRREGKEPESASTPTKTATRSAGRSTQGSQSRQASTSKSALAKEPMQTTFQMKETSHPEFDTGAEDQPIIQSSQYPEWFSQQHKPPSLDRDWNKTVPATYGSIQLWISELAKLSDSRSSFNELMDTPLDFSNFIINRLKLDTLTLKLLVGPTYELMKGSCKSLGELEYHLEEVFKATTDQLDWVNPKGQQYPHNLFKPLPLIPNNQGRRVILFDHFINNDLEYLRGGASSRKYTTSITKTKAADYGHIKWIKDLVPKTMWIEEPIGYDKHALWGRRIIAVTELKIVEWHNYRHLDWIMVRIDDDKLYKFKEGDFKRLRIQDIEDILLLLRRVEDLQLDVESYQKKLNLTKPDTHRFDLKRKEAYIAYSNPRGFFYQNKDKKNRLMRIDELHKFSDGTLTNVRTTLDDHLKGIRMQLEEGCTRET